MDIKDLKGKYVIIKTPRRNASGSKLLVGRCQIATGLCTFYGPNKPVNKLQITLGRTPFSLESESDVLAYYATQKELRINLLEIRVKHNLV